MKIPPIVKVFILIVIPVWVISFLCVKWALTDKVELTPFQEIEYRIERNEPRKAADAAFRHLKEDLNDFTRHAIFLNQYLPLPQNEKTMLLQNLADVLGDPAGYYQKMSGSVIENERNIGLYGGARFNFFLSHTNN
ncbi:MAG: hypothetical protein ACHQF2_08815, partial [Flavobacteriales bacterium]